MSELNETELQHIAYMQTLEIQKLQARIAELEGKIDQLTARWRQERQDDKSSNDTQTQTFVYGKESEE